MTLSVRLLSGLALALGPGVCAAMAQDAATAAELKSQIAAVQKNADIIWTAMAACLVFFMQAGFAMVETGFTRAKSAGNIMMKNLMDFCLGGVAFWAAGFGLMFGVSNGVVGASNFFVNFDNATADGQWGFTFWMFQMVFAATAATIVSGAMAERTKFSAYLVYSFFITLLIYPVMGHWGWGSFFHAANDQSGSWLVKRGFIDFAGSTMVHSVGGWAALAGAIVVGPRIGKFLPDGRIRPIPGHSLTLAALGVFILYFGWFGFNAGSTTAANGSVARIAVNTLLAGCTGALGALAVSWLKFGKADIGMTLNGVLAGLVGITAPCATTVPAGALMIGAVAGVLVVYSVLFFDKIKVDDPVGAISVHGVGGVFGTVAVALFHENLFNGTEYDLMGQLLTQLIGAGTAFAWTFPTALLLFFLIKKTIGLRVSAADELEGLDLGEHAANSYPDFAPATGAAGIAAADNPLEAAQRDVAAAKPNPAEA